MMPSLQNTLLQPPEMDELQFNRWQSLLEERTGMYLTPQRRTFLQTSLNMRMREIGCASYQDYYQLVLKGPAAAIEWSTLVDRLTVQETRFFRDKDALAFVEDQIKELARTLPTEVPIELWSVGCSSGEEAYSLAFIAEDLLGSKARQYAVTGTDISNIVLRKARIGQYSLKALNFVPEHYAQLGFVPVANALEVRKEIRERCCFSQVNILNLANFPLNMQHIIYCQNVLIYFRRWRRREILNSLVEHLAPGGVLIIGLGEIVDYQHPQLEQVQSNKICAFVRKKINSNGESARR